MKSRKKILLITTSYYPQNRISVLRVGQWAKYWSKMGCDVTVLTTKKYSFMGPFGLDSDYGENIELVEVDYLPSYIARRMGVVKGTKQASTKKSKPYSKIKKIVRKFRGICGSLFDIHDLWIEKAYIEGKSILDKDDYDLIVSSYSPPAVHVVADRLKREFPNVFWIADFRDLWAYNHLQKAAGLFGVYERYKEKKTLQSSDVILTVSDPLTNTMNKIYPAKNIKTVENGFDEEEFPNWRKNQYKVENIDKLIITYTGTIYEGKRDPTPLIHACNQLIEDGIMDKCRVQINFYGNNTSVLTDLINKNDLNKYSIINLNGFVSRKESIRAQANSDLLLFLEWNDPSALGVLTGKLFEYLVSGVPILGVGIDSSTTAGALIERAQVGKSAVSSENIKLILEEILSEGKVSFYKPNSEVIELFSRENQAKKIIEMI